MFSKSTLFPPGYLGSWNGILKKKELVCQLATLNVIDKYVWCPEIANQPWVECSLYPDQERVINKWMSKELLWAFLFKINLIILKLKSFWRVFLEKKTKLTQDLKTQTTRSEIQETTNAAVTQPKKIMLFLYCDIRPCKSSVITIFTNALHSQ